MDDLRNSRIRQLQQLRVELAQAGELLDELERRHFAREPSKEASTLSSESQICPNDAEIRFAACVSHGLAKLGPKRLRSVQANDAAA